MLKVKCKILAPGQGPALVVSGDISITERGSVSDVTGCARMWIRVMIKVKCQILATGLVLALFVRFLETLALPKELGSVSDVTGCARMWIRVMIKVKCQILATGLVLALFVRFLETLALPKELGSVSDVTGCARMWIRVMIKVKCQILATGLVLALFVRFLETLALPKELGSVSDVTGVQECGSGLWKWTEYSSGSWLGMTEVNADSGGSVKLAWAMDRISCKGKSMRMTRLWREFRFISDGEYAIQFQDYSESRLISMVLVEFQAIEFASDPDVSAMARLSFRFTCGMTDVEADGVLRERKMVDQGFGEAWVTYVVMNELQVYGD
ncbi:Hydrocephalus-Inducing Protein [Manis pentadactyla]|nr:Hydrocephalus-Inducing Protein [Manis pentadactyla]